MRGGRTAIFSYVLVCIVVQHDNHKVSLYNYNYKWRVPSYISLQLEIERRNKPMCANDGTDPFPVKMASSHYDAYIDKRALRHSQVTG